MALLRKALDAKAALWIGIENSSTHPYCFFNNIQGFYKEWSFDLSNPYCTNDQHRIEEDKDSSPIDILNSATILNSSSIGPLSGSDPGMEFRN